MLFSLCGYLPHSGFGVLKIWVILVILYCSTLRLGKVFRKLILYCLPLRMFVLCRKYPAVQFCLPFGYFVRSTVRCLQTFRYGYRITVSTVFTCQFLLAIPVGDALWDSTSSFFFFLFFFSFFLPFFSAAILSGPYLWNRHS